MLPIPEKKALVMKLRDPSRVTSVIHRHQMIEEDGQQYLAVPHKTDSFLVLRNLGINVQGMEPIKHLYPYPRLHGRYDPMAHQRSTAEFLSTHPRCFVLNEQRTGKTSALIWATDFLMTEKTVKKVLVVSTMSTMRRVWRDEIFAISPSRSVAVLHGPKEVRTKLLRGNFDYYVINHDGLVVMKPELIEAISSGRIDAIIVDEGGEFAEHTTTKYAALKAICAAAKFVWWLTATPASRGPDKVWAQCQIINPSSVPEQYSEWRLKVMWQVKKRTRVDPTNPKKLKPRVFIKWFPREDSGEIVFKALQPAIRFKKRDVLKDLPPLTHQQLDVELTPEQTKLINALRREGASIYDGQVIEAVNAAVLIGKVMQVCAGVVKDDQGEPVLIPCKPRLDVLMGLIEATDAKVIIFATYRNVVDMLVAEIGKHHKVISIDGRVTGGARERALQSFADDKDMKCLIAHPKTVAHGLEFSVADTTVWWSPYSSAGGVAQANERMASAAQKNPMGIYYLQGHFLEREAYATVRDGLNFQERALALFKGWMGGVDNE